MPHANNKGADPCSLINAFIVRCLDSIISLLAIAEQSDLRSYLVANPEDRFSRDIAHIILSVLLQITPVRVTSLNVTQRAVTVFLRGGTVMGTMTAAITVMNKTVVRVTSL